MASLSAMSFYCNTSLSRVVFLLRPMPIWAIAAMVSLQSLRLSILHDSFLLRNFSKFTKRSLISPKSLPEKFSISILVDFLNLDMSLRKPDAPMALFEISRLRRAWYLFFL